MGVLLNGRMFAPIVAEYGVCLRRSAKLDITLLPIHHAEMVLHDVGSHPPWFMERSWSDGLPPISVQRESA
jgi:Cu/Ag efflux pump CusA